MPDLPPEVDMENFSAHFSVPDLECNAKKKLKKIFPKKTVPQWLEGLGSVSINQSGKLAINISESLVAMVAGCDKDKPLSFSIESNVDLLEEIINLANEKLDESEVPSIQGAKPRTSWQIISLKNQVKALTCMMAFVNGKLSSTMKDPEILNEVVLPGLDGLINSIFASVRHLRFEIMPQGTPGDLRKKLLDAPLSPVFPTERVEEIRRFFREKRSEERRRLRGRGIRVRGFRVRTRGRFSQRGGRFRGGWGGRRVFGGRRAYQKSRSTTPATNNP